MASRNDKNDKQPGPTPIEKREPVELLKEAQALDGFTKTIALPENPEPEDIKAIVDILTPRGDQLDSLTRDLQAHYKWERTQTLISPMRTNTPTLLALILYEQ